MLYEWGNNFPYFWIADQILDWKFNGFNSKCQLVSYVDLMNEWYLSTHCIKGEWWVLRELSSSILTSIYETKFGEIRKMCNNQITNWMFEFLSIINRTANITVEIISCIPYLAKRISEPLSKSNFGIEI